MRPTTWTTFASTLALATLLVTPVAFGAPGGFSPGDPDPGPTGQRIPLPEDPAPDRDGDGVPDVDTSARDEARKERREKRKEERQRQRRERAPKRSPFTQMPSSLALDGLEV